MQKNGQWTEELKLLAGIISSLPFDKAIKWGAEVFTYKGRNVVSYGGFKNYFALWFFNGVFLKDADKVLVNAQEGKTKGMRQWRFKSKAEIDRSKIVKYLKEAIEIEKKGLKIVPEYFKAIPIPDLLNKELEQNKKLKTKFESLTPGRQKEYIMFINEAKLEKTKMQRLQKLIPMISQGIGLNDKYKKS